MFGTARFNKRGYPTFIVLNVMPVVLFCAVFLYGQVAHAQNLAPEKLDSLVFAVGEDRQYLPFEEYRVVFAPLRLDISGARHL